MTITVPLTTEEQAALQSQANAFGVSVDSLIRRAVLEIIKPQQKQLSSEEFGKAFEEIAEMIPDNVPPLSDAALSRENIYTREDEW